MRANTEIWGVINVLLETKFSLVWFEYFRGLRITLCPLLPTWTQEIKTEKKNDKQEKKILKSENRKKKNKRKKGKE